MKICMLMHLVGGDSIRFCKIAHTLKQAGHSVTVVTFLPDKPDNMLLKDLTEGLHITHLKSAPFHKRLVGPLRRFLSERQRKAVMTIIERGSGHGIQPTRFIDLLRAKKISWAIKWALGSSRIHHYLFGWLVVILYLAAFIPFALFIRLFPIGLLLFVEYCYCALQCLKKQKPEAYYAFDTATLVTGLLATRLMRGKLVYDYHNQWYVRDGEADSTASGRSLPSMMERFLLRRVDACITASENACRDLKQRYPHIAITSVLNTANPHLPAQSCDTIGPQQTHDDRRTLLYIGDLIPDSGMEELVQCLKYLENCVLFLLGNGHPEYIAQLKTLARKHKVSDLIQHVEARKARQMVTNALSADIGVFPIKKSVTNQYRCAPLGFFECIACALPIAVGNLPDLKTYVEEYQVGITFDPEYPRDIANAISFILDDVNTYKRIKEKVIQAAKALNWDNESRKLLDVYMSLSSEYNHPS